MTAYQSGIAKFADADTVIFGISTDDLDTQKKFAESLNLEFTLLSDAEGKAARAFQVLNEKNMANRTTFVIDKQGVVQEIISGGDAISIDGAAAACSRLQH
ncbi:MAG: redoxin domain-containing protein [Acidobacteria bacterium]|nr:redoxin domain-containing protein [Acidobacteriota bacterium]